MGWSQYQSNLARALLHSLTFFSQGKQIAVLASSVEATMRRHSKISAYRSNSLLSYPPRFSHKRALRLSIHVCPHFQTRRAQSTSKKSNTQERPLGGKLAIITGSARGMQPDTDTACSL